MAAGQQERLNKMLEGAVSSSQLLGKLMRDLRQANKASMFGPAGAAAKSMAPWTTESAISGSAHDLAMALVKERSGAQANKMELQGIKKLVPHLLQSEGARFKSYLALQRGKLSQAQSTAKRLAEQGHTAYAKQFRDVADIIRADMQEQLKLLGR
jgi:hypothetical protein